MKEVFVKLFTPFLLAFVQSLHAAATAGNTAISQNGMWDFATSLSGWNSAFDKLLRRFEDKAADVWSSLLSTLRLN